MYLPLSFIVSDMDDDQSSQDVKPSISGQQMNEGDNVLENTGGPAVFVPLAQEGSNEQLLGQVTEQVRP